MADVKAGVYRHYKGPLYLLLGLAHDANAATLTDAARVRQWYDVDRRAGVAMRALEERTVVVYIGLQLDDAHTGPRLAVRTADDFFADVHMGNPDRFTEGTACAGTCKYNRINGVDITTSDEHKVVPRFEYLGPTWEGAH